MLLFFLFSFALMHRGLFEHLSIGYIGGFRGDAGIYTWLVKVFRDRILGWPSVGFDGGIFHPFGNSIGYSDNFFFPSFIVFILTAFGFNEMAAYNLTILGASVFNGYCTYLLARYLWRDRSISIFCGFVFMCLPYFAFHRGHPQLQFAFTIPLTLLAALTFCESRARGAAFAIGAVVTLAFMCAVYYAMYCYLLAGVTLCVYFLRRGWREAWRAAITLAIFNAPWLVLLLVMIEPYREVQRAFGAVGPAIIKMHSPTLLAFLSAPRINQLWSPFTKGFSSFEGYLFFGFSTLLLLIIALVMIYRHDTSGVARSRSRISQKIGILIGLFSLLGATLYVSVDSAHRPLVLRSLGESLPLWILLSVTLAQFLASGAAAQDERSLTLRGRGLLLGFLLVFFVFSARGVIGSRVMSPPFPELYKLLYYLPGYHALRGVSRMGIVADLLAILIAGYALSVLLRVQCRRQRVARFGICAALIVLSGFELHSRPETIRIAPRVPAIYRMLPRGDSRSAVLSLPIHAISDRSPDFMNHNSLYINWAEASGMRTVNGFSGKVPLFYVKESELFDHFPEHSALSRIGQFVDLRYVILNRRYLGKEKLKSKMKEVRAHPDEITILAKDKHKNVLLEVRPSIRLSELPEKALFIHTSRAGGERIEFEIRNESGESQEIRMVFKNDLGCRNCGELYQERLNGDWRTITLDIPRADNLVPPHKLEFLSLSGAKFDHVRIRNIRTYSSQP